MITIFYFDLILLPLDFEILRCYETMINNLRSRGFIFFLKACDLPCKQTGNIHLFKCLFNTYYVVGAILSAEGIRVNRVIIAVVYRAYVFIGASES